MKNREIASAFRELGQLMELHKDNPFKIRSYSNAYIKLRKLDTPLAEMTAEEIGALPGIGPAITSKIGELTSAGKMETLEKWREKTPAGVRQMLKIDGFGPKKIRTIWKDLGVESIGELMYAVNENRLVELKGFGAKTQEDLRQRLLFFQRSQGQFYYRDLIGPAQELLEKLATNLPDGTRTELTGELRRAVTTPAAIELLTTAAAEQLEALATAGVISDLDGSSDSGYQASYEELPVKIYCCTDSNWGSRQFRYSGSSTFIQTFAGENPQQDFSGLATEAAVFEKAGVQFVPAELRESDWAYGLAKNNQVPQLIEATDIRGVVHSHSTYSDGIHTLRAMAEAARDRGFGYLVITDHSQAAFYANGLKADRVQEQWAEIDQLNEELAPFRIVKGIESDILNDGSLDYPEDILAGFELIIASVHSNLRMDKAKATQRLLTAIQNPYTHMLGHPTGRLLLSREGYPIDHEAVIQACAEHRVAIELNANPARLDLDWSWIPYAMECGVPISINPDAHATGGIDDIQYGVLAARKGGLTKEHCLNSRELEAFLGYWA